MDFELDDEQAMLKTSAREFLTKECPKDLVRDMMDDATGYSPKLWKKMADLGWQALIFPEQYGGVDMSFLDLAVLLEEMGRALLPGPFVPTVLLAGQPILAAGTEDQKEKFLSAIADGEMLMTLALMEENGGIEASDIATKATPAGDGFSISGTKMFVPDAHVADHILCVARTTNGADKADGITLFLVDAKSEGIKTEVLPTLTGQKLCKVVFDNVTVPETSVLGEVDGGWPTMKTVLEQATIAECAWMAGGAQWVLDTSVAYAKERVQFGKQIGSFQAIQHKCANMAIDVEGAVNITYYAAWAVAEGEPDVSMAASMAKAWCSDIYTRAAADGIQIHGGIGFTWEHDMHLYFKRAKTSEVTYGNGDYHREKVAEMLEF
jgi:alkylation response protein AidB-like acyl-CoA dehydrogenase